MNEQELNRKLAKQTGYKGTPEDTAYLEAEALAEKNRKLAEWVGMINFTDKIGSVYDYSGKLHKEPPDFTQSLDACFKWLVPKVIDKIMAEQECSSDLAYSILFKKWLQRLECDIPNHEGTLCEAIWEIIQ